MESDDALFSHLTYLLLQHYLAKEETQKTALSTSFLLNRAPKSPKLNALITRFRESYRLTSNSSVSISRVSK